MPNYRFDADTVREVRTSPESNAWWAQRLGCSREAVRQIRAGTTYRNLMQDGDPIGGASCDRCIHWQNLEATDPCGLGHRDLLSDGLGFARICPTFMAERS